jgi:hypothetical protein
MSSSDKREHKTLSAKRELIKKLDRGEKSSKEALETKDRKLLALFFFVTMQ